jgi:hypothetical protein
MPDVWNRGDRGQSANGTHVLLRAASDRAGGVVANALGKRYNCPECEATVLVTKPGEGTLECHGQAMLVVQPKPLPSAD